VGVRNWKTDLGRAVAGAIGTALAFWLTGSAVAGIGGLVVGLAVAFAAEYILRLRSEVARLHSIESELASEKESRAEERKLREYEVFVAKRQVAIAEIELEVWGGAFREAQESGNFPSLPVILARIDVMQKAKNLHIPLPPPP
jgi:hypothetical protein